MTSTIPFKVRIIQEIFVNQRRTFSLANLFEISKEINISLIVKKIRSMKGCILCKYNTSNNTFIVFGSEEFLKLAEKLITVIEKHYSNVCQQNECLPEAKKIGLVQHRTLTLNKNIYDLVKNKIDTFKKQYSIRFDIKQKKENKISLEWDYKV